MKDLNKQYDDIADDFSKILINGNIESREAFHEYLPESLKGKKVLDLGCGNGYETQEYIKRGASKVIGIDASVELLGQACEKYKSITFKEGLFQDIPMEDISVDYIFSKYALQTARKLDPVWKEVYRVLRPGGTFMFLVVHPIRQLYEKKKQPKDYFLQEVVESVCFDGKLTFSEPTHTLKEYLSSFMTSNFTLDVFDERTDAAAEKIIDTYPQFLILKWTKN